MAKKKLAAEIRDSIGDLVFGMEDGLISNLGLVLGVAAAGVPNTTVLLAGFASMFAGAVSMAAETSQGCKVYRQGNKAFCQALEREQEAHAQDFGRRRARHSPGEV